MAEQKHLFFLYKGLGWGSILPMYPEGPSLNRWCPDKHLVGKNPYITDENGYFITLDNINDEFLALYPDLAAPYALRMPPGVVAVTWDPTKKTPENFSPGPQEWLRPILVDLWRSSPHGSESEAATYYFRISGKDEEVDAIIRNLKTFQVGIGNCKMATRYLGWVLAPPSIEMNLGRPTQWYSPDSHHSASRPPAVEELMPLANFELEWMLALANPATQPVNVDLHSEGVS